MSSEAVKRTFGRSGPDFCERSKACPASVVEARNERRVVIIGDSKIIQS